MTRFAFLLPFAVVSFWSPALASEEGASESAVTPVPLPEPQPVGSALETRGLPVPEVAPLATGDAADAPEAGEKDEPLIEEKIEAESAEMEDLRKAEEKAKVLEPLSPEESAERAASRLGLESPLRLRLREAFDRDVAPAPAEPRGSIALLPELDHDLKRLQAEYDIPIEVNEAVVAYIRFFQGDARKHFARWIGRSHRYLDRYRDIMREHGLPEDTVFLAMIESGFANLAYSRARASGPWQFIGPTGKRMGLKQDFWVDERRDPEKSAHAAARYLKELFQQTGDWRLAWAGYNAGVGKIFKAQRKGQADFWSMTRGRVLKKETKGYVPKLMAAAIVTKHPQAFGFTADGDEAERWLDYEEVTIPAATELAAVAKAAEVPERQLLDMNPELRRSCTPPRAYQLKIPKGTADVFARNFPKLELSGRLAFAHHRVQRGDTMTAIATAYGVSAPTIARMNGLRLGRRVRPGTELVIPLTSLARRHAAATVEVARAPEEPPQRPVAAVAKESLRAIASPVAELAGRIRATVLVHSGDSLWAIAQKFGVGLTELCRWNGIKNPRRHRLQVGQELVVFARAGGANVPAPGTPPVGPG